jgi:hypothetical protein
MPERILSARALNRALLARQLLLERSGLSVPKALERVAGLQTQYAPSGYVGLWSRLRDFRRDALTRALTSRRAIQATLMRTTIHMVSAGDFPLFAAGVRRGRREWWLRVHRAGMTGRDMDRAARVVRRRLLEGPATADELSNLLAAQGFPPAASSGVGLWLDLVRVPPSGTWERRRADRYGLAETWLGQRGAGTPTEAQGMEHLVRRYLGGFGPASPDDVARWAGLPPAMVRPVLDRMDLRGFRDETGGLLLDLPRAPLPDPDEPAPVRFLPTWDATLLVHARRTLILPEHHRPRVFDTRTPHSVPTFLVDGAVAGSWRYEEGRIRLTPFEALPRRVRHELRDEADRLAVFHERGL